MQMSEDVKWIRTLVVTFLRETPEVRGPRGWAEAAVEYVKVEPYNEQGGLLLELNGERYRLSSEVVEAIYDMHQGVPR